MRNETEILGLFNFVNKTVGRVDVLVNNAGVTRETSLINVSSEGLRTTFEVDVLAPVLCSREALKIMFDKQIKSGYIMFTNSIHGERIVESHPPMRPDIYVYEAAKHALKVIREGLRQELRARGSRIRVGEVSPASVVTNIYESTISRDDKDTENVKRLFHDAPSVEQFERLSPDDVAEAFVYMLQAPERMDINTIVLSNIPK